MKEKRKRKKITFIIDEHVHQEFLKIAKDEDRTQVKVFERLISFYNSEILEGENENKNLSR